MLIGHASQLVTHQGSVERAHLLGVTPRHEAATRKEVYQLVVLHDQWVL